MKTTYAIIGYIHSETAGKVVYEVTQVFQTEDVQDAVICLNRFRDDPAWGGFQFSLFVKLS